MPPGSARPGLWPIEHRPGAPLDPPATPTRCPSASSSSRKLKEEALHAGSEAVGPAPARAGQAHRPRAHRPARSTRARSSSSTCSPATGPTASASRTTGRSPTVSSPAGARSTAARCSCSRQDFTIFGGALGEVFAEKIHKVMDLAESVGAPLIGLNDGAGARIQEGVVSLASYGGIFFRNVKASGVIPQISVVLGPCAGGAVYSPAMTDFIFMVKGTSNMFITGPDVVKTVTGEDVTQEELGGAMTHATKSGVATFVADDEQTCLEQVRYLLSFLPSNNLEDPPYFEPTTTPTRSCDGIIDLIPDSPNQPYDMKKVIADVVDDGDFFEVVPALGDEHRVRVRARRRPRRRHRRQPAAGARRAASTSTRRRRRPASCARATRSTSRSSRSSTCPASCPAPTRSTAGSSATAPSCSTRTARRPCPRVQIITRKGYGGAYVVMNSKSIGADIAFAWPSAEIAVMGAPRRGQHHLPPRDRGGRRPRGQRRPSSSSEYEERFANPYKAAERGYVDDVIDPRDTRADARRVARRCCARSASSCRRASTATCRL